MVEGVYQGRPCPLRVKTGPNTTSAPRSAFGGKADLLLGPA